ncbi:phage minor capsid protein [Tessaracoccus sp.]
MTTGTVEVGVTTAVQDALLAEVVDVYAQVENALLSQMAKRLSTGAGIPTWAKTKLMELASYRAAVSKELASAGGKAAGPLAQALLLGEKMGRRQALAEMRRAYPGMDQAELSNVLNSASRIRPLMKEAVSKVTGQHAQILRSAEDIYRKVITTASASQTLGAVNHRQAVQKALDTFATNGVTGFVDKSGRRWDLESYTKMATHTATHRAHIEGHLNALTDLGVSLVYVSDHRGECDLCRPWEGKVLLISGDPRTPLPPGVPIAGTLAGAQSAGFMHPFCRHTLGAYFPGITQLPTNTASPADAEHRDKLRALERGARYWDRRAAVATTPDAKAKAAAKAKEWRGKIRQHKAANPTRRLNYAESQAEGYAPGGKPPRAPRAPRTPVAPVAPAVAPRKRLFPDSYYETAPRRAVAPEPPKAPAAPKTPVAPVAPPRYQKTFQEWAKTNAPQALKDHPAPAPKAPTKPKTAPKAKPAAEKAPVAKTRPGLAVQGVNPTGSRDNCTNCTAAFELKMRTGKKLKALPRPVGRPRDEVEASWGDATWVNTTGQGMASRARTVLSQPGQRGVMVVTWKGTHSGHIVNVVNENGVINVYDAQSGVAQTLEYYQGRVGTVALARVDNVSFKGDLSDYVE